MSRKISIALVLAVFAAFAGYALWSIFLAPSGLPPEGFARGNGRIEADLVDVSTRLPGRVARVAVQDPLMTQSLSKTQSAGCPPAATIADSIESLIAARGGTSTEPHPAIAVEARIIPARTSLTT